MKKQKQFLEMLKSGGLLLLKEGRVAEGKKVIFFPKYLKENMFVTSLNSCTFKQAKTNRKRPLVLTHPSSTFKRWKEKPLFPFLHLASPCLSYPRAPCSLVHHDGKACCPLHPFKSVAFNLLFTGDCPGAYEAKSIFK